MCALLMLGTTMAEGTPTVRMIYLVPSDRVIQPGYTAAIESAITQLQIWYRNEMGNGKTFLLHTPMVEIYETPHPASWYAANPAGDFVVWFWNNALADGFALTGGRFFDPENRWIFYIDADPACGQLTGGTSGVALLPANDLRGLTGQQNRPPCLGEPPDTAGICRWVGGLGHELGHAFDLPHPAGCEDSDPATFCPSDSLLWLGFREYPDTYLLPEDKVQLNASPFFLPINLPETLPPCGVVSVAIDIKPGETPNPINPKSKGNIPVAILSAATFDAPAEVDRASLTFGRTGQEASLAFCSPSPEDVNADSVLDLVCHFTIQQTGFQAGDTAGVLKGKTIDGTPLEGTDAVRIVP